MISAFKTVSGTTKAFALTKLVNSRLEFVTNGDVNEKVAAGIDDQQQVVEGDKAVEPHRWEKV